MPIRVVVGDDSLIVREGLVQLLGTHPDVDVVAAAGDLPSLRDACERARPDVVITDIRMPPAYTDEGIRLAAELRESHPRIGVVVVSQYSDPSFALDLLEHGSDRRAYLLKDRVHDRVELMGAIRAVAGGGSLIDPTVVEALIVARSQAERSPIGDLTAREREVLREVAQGKNNEAIAESLFLTRRGVEKHINAIFMKLGLTDADVHKRVTATLMLLAEGEAVTPDADVRRAPPDRR